MFPEVGSGRLSFCHVNPDSGVPCRVHVHPVKADSVKVAHVSDVDTGELVDDPDDDIVSPNEYASAVTVGEGGAGVSEVVPVESADGASVAPDRVIDRKLARWGKAFQIAGQVAVAAGTVGGMGSAFILGPLGGMCIAFAGMGVFLGLNAIGERLKRKAGMTREEARKLPGGDGGSDGTVGGVTTFIGF